LYAIRTIRACRIISRIVFDGLLCGVNSANINGVCDSKFASFCANSAPRERGIGIEYLIIFIL
jgi:hypothetical protein